VEDLCHEYYVREYSKTPAAVPDARHVLKELPTKRMIINRVGPLQLPLAAQFEKKSWLPLWRIVTLANFLFRMQCSGESIHAKTAGLRFSSLTSLKKLQGEKKIANMSADVSVESLMIRTRHFSEVGTRGTLTTDALRHGEQPEPFRRRFTRIKADKKPNSAGFEIEIV